jgi:hypothetical protein
MSGELLSSDDNHKLYLQDGCGSISFEGLQRLTAIWGHMVPRRS